MAAMALFVQTMIKGNAMNPSPHLSTSTLAFAQQTQQSMCWRVLLLRRLAVLSLTCSRKPWELSVV